MRNHEIYFEYNPEYNFIFSDAMEYIARYPKKGEAFSEGSLRVKLFSHAINIVNHLYGFTFPSAEDQWKKFNIFAHVLWCFYIYHKGYLSWKSIQRKTQNEITLSLSRVIQKIKKDRLRYNQINMIKKSVENNDPESVIELIENNISKTDVKSMIGDVDIFIFLNKKIPSILAQYNAVNFYMISLSAAMFYRLIDTLKSLEQANEEVDAQGKQATADWFYIRQGVGTNTFMDAIPREHDVIEYDAITKKSTIRKKNFTLEYDGSVDDVKNGLNIKTLRLFEALIYRFTLDGSCNEEITMSVSGYMGMCGLSNRDRAVKDIDKSLNFLSRIKMAWEETRKRALSKYDNIHIFGKRKGNKIFVTLSPAFFQYLSKQPIMHYPMALFRIDHNENPHSYFIARKFASHKRINWKNKKSDGHTLSVENLMQATPLLPSYEKVRETGGQYKQRITTPFMRDLDELVDRYGIFSTVSIIPKQGCNVDPTNDLTYDELQMCNVKVEWNDHLALGDIVG